MQLLVVYFLMYYQFMVMNHLQLNTANSRVKEVLISGILQNFPLQLAMLKKMLNAIEKYFDRV